MGLVGGLAPGSYNGRPAAESKCPAFAAFSLDDATVALF